MLKHNSTLSLMKVGPLPPPVLGVSVFLWKGVVTHFITSFSGEIIEAPRPK